MVTSVALFLFLGGLLSAGALILTAALDRTIRFPSDTEARLGVSTIAAVPHVRA
jgi:capsular polysaccharide biosynthesis protein